jgi:hypothetical protein
MDFSIVFSILFLVPLLARNTNVKTMSNIIISVGHGSNPKASITETPVLSNINLIKIANNAAQAGPGMELNILLGITDSDNESADVIANTKL